MSDTKLHMENALRCLFIATEADVARDVGDAVFAHVYAVETQLADLARLAKALCDALPRCLVAGCRNASMRGESDESPGVCDSCAADDLNGEEPEPGDGYQDLSWAAPLRALQAKLATLDGAAGGESAVIPTHDTVLRFIYDERSKLNTKKRLDGLSADETRLLRDLEECIDVLQRRDVEREMLPGGRAFGMREKNNVIRAARALRDATANLVLRDESAREAWERLDKAFRDHDDALVAVMAEDDAPAAAGETKGGGG